VGPGDGGPLSHTVVTRRAIADSFGRPRSLLPPKTGCNRTATTPPYVPTVGTVRGFAAARKPRTS